MTTRLGRYFQRKMPFLLAFYAVVSLVPSHAVIAQGANNQLVITQTPSSATINSSFTVQVKAYIDSSASPQSAIGSVTYPSNLLRVTGKSTAGSSFGNPSMTESSGSVNFNASRSSSDTGFAQILNISFVTIGAGTAVIGFSGDSRVNAGTTGYKSGVVSISSPAPSTAPKPSSAPKPSVAPAPIISTTPTPTPTPSESPEPQPTPDPTGIVNSVSTQPQYNSATVTWSVNATSPSSTFAYGERVSALDKYAVIEKTANGGFSATIKDLEPGERYYFAIVGTGDGGKSGTYSGTVIASGFPVIMTITENDQPAQNAKVKIGNKNYSASTNGKLAVGLASGEYSGTITTQTASLYITFTVAKKTIPSNGSAPESQPFSYNLTSSPLAAGPGSQASILAFVGVLVGGTLVLGFGFVGFMAYRRKKFESDNPTLSTSSSTVIIDDGYDWRSDATSPATPPVDDSAGPSGTPRHNNSVYLDEEEPIDMFDKTNQPSGRP